MTVTLSLIYSEYIRTLSSLVTLSLYCGNRRKRNFGSRGSRRFCGNRGPRGWRDKLGKIKGDRGVIYDGERSKMRSGKRVVCVREGFERVEVDTEVDWFYKEVSSEEGTHGRNPKIDRRHGE